MTPVCNKWFSTQDFKSILPLIIVFLLERFYKNINKYIYYFYLTFEGSQTTVLGDL